MPVVSTYLQTVTQPSRPPRNLNIDSMDRPIRVNCKLPCRFPLPIIAVNTWCVSAKVLSYCHNVKDITTLLPTIVFCADGLLSRCWPPLAAPGDADTTAAMQYNAM